MEPSNLKVSKNNTNSTEAGAEEDYENIDPDTASDNDLEEYHERVRSDFRYDLLAHDNYIQNFDSYEAMLISRPYDSVSKKVQNGLSDGRTTTIYQERAARVCGQLPSGQMKAAGEKDEGAGAALDIILQKYIYPNANAQAPLLEKFRNWQFYSSVYGFMPMFYDWDVNERTGYIGPNCWLWHPRNFIPQIGRSSVDDMDYANAITFVSEPYLKELMEEPEDAGWDKDEIEVLLDLIEERMRQPDSRRDSLITRERQSQAEKGRIMLATRYEAGDDGNWVVFAPEYDGVIIRTIRNPHKNGQIPFVIKYATPLFDNFYGLGDFQRAKPLQFASDGLDNFYFAALKRSLYSPTIINPAGVVKSSITQDPGAIWQEIVPNSIREYNTSPIGMNTYQSAKTLMNGALLSQSGTVDTSMTAADSGSPSASKTDAGVQQQQQKESDRDNQDRFYLESRQEVLVDRMMGLLCNIGTEDIKVNLFIDDFKDIDAAGWGDELKQMIKISKSKQSAKMTINPDFFKNLDVRFHLDSNSTAASTKQTQLASLKDFVKSMSSLQNEMVDMKAMGWMLDLVQVAKLEEQLGDVPEMSKIFRKMTPEETQAYQQQQAQAQGPAQKPPEIIDTMAYKDLPDWAKEAELQKQGYQIPQGGDVQTTEQKLKAAEVATKMHTAASQSPELQPTPPPEAEPTPPPEFHRGTLIKDPAIADAHKKIGERLNG